MNNIRKLRLNGKTFQNVESVQAARDTITHMGLFDTLYDQLFDNGSKHRALELTATKVLCQKAAEWLDEHPEQDIPFDVLQLLTGEDISGSGESALRAVNRAMILAQCKLFDLVHPDARELLARKELVVSANIPLGQREVAIVFSLNDSDEAKLLALRWPLDAGLKTRLDEIGSDQKDAFRRLKEARYHCGMKAGEAYAANPAHGIQIQKAQPTLSGVANMIAREVDPDWVFPADVAATETMVSNEVLELRVGIKSSAANLEKACWTVMSAAKRQRKIQILPVLVTERGFGQEDHMVLLICDPGGRRPLIVDSKQPHRGYPTSVDWIATDLQSPSDTTTCASHVARQCLHYTYMLTEGVKLADLSPYGIPGADH